MLQEINTVGAAMLLQSGGGSKASG